jgi:predicted PolB exonuclease-like 3'-5' exonuclease
MSNYILDIETIANERLGNYKETFEPAPPEPEPEVEEEVRISPKTGKPLKAKAKPKPKSEGRAKARKSDKPGLSYLTGRIICVGIKPENKAPVMLVNKDEEALLQELYDYMAARAPFTVISFNGRSFDIPFITMRGLLYNINFADVLSQERFSKTHIDLYETIGGKWGMSCKLAELAWFLGLEAVEGKGSEVQDMYDRGDLQSISDHCQSDIETTEKIYFILHGSKKRKV